MAGVTYDLLMCPVADVVYLVAALMRWHENSMMSQVTEHVIGEMSHVTGVTSHVIDVTSHVVGEMSHVTVVMGCAAGQTSHGMNMPT